MRSSVFDLPRNEGGFLGSVLMPKIQMFGVIMRRSPTSVLVALLQSQKGDVFGEIEGEYSGTRHCSDFGGLPFGHLNVCEVTLMPSLCDFCDWIDTHLAYQYILS